MDNGTLTEWNRLEPRPRSTDTSRPLRAEIRDPLWLMTRQWQMGEVTAEDAASPIIAKVSYSNSLLSKVKLGNEKATVYDNSLPLETIVERENLQVISRSSGQDYINDLALSLTFASRIKKLIKKQFSATQARTILTSLHNHPELQLESINPSAAPENYNNAILSTNNELRSLHSALNKRSFHGGKLYQKLKAGEDLSSIATGGNGTILDQISKAAISWFEELLNQTSDAQNPGAWQGKRLEYKYALSAPGSTDPHVLEAQEYHGGRLDWFSSDFTITKDTDKDLTSNLPKANFRTERDEVFPSDASFSGMPRNRWWEFEDSKINFGKIEPKKSDLSKILFAEFGLLFANDWSIIPLNMPYGSLAHVDDLIIKDNFGQYTISKHYKTDTDNAHWSFLQIYNPDQPLTKQIDECTYIPPVVHNSMESEAIEKINFVRDEMANMVWAIEVAVPNGLGDGADGYHMGRELREYYNRLGTPSSATVDNPAKIKYILTNEVPENWIPFIAVKMKDSSLSRQIQLQRGQMPRIISGLPRMVSEPRTSLLLKEISPYFVHEEEVPKSGMYISLHWQRTRMANGKTVVWLARRRTNGRGEGYSNLMYDQILPTDNQ